MNATQSVLSGVRIVELGHVPAGHFTTSLCADFGAEVIKVEDPQHGDMMRTVGPDKNGIKLWWKVTGRNKKCVTLNLKHPRGLELCRQLIAQADAVVENFRPGVLKKLGLGHDDMRKVNPKLIIVGISGYGLTWPMAEQPGYGRIAEAYSGVMQVTGEPDGAPLAPGFSTADVTTGAMAAFGLVSRRQFEQVTGYLESGVAEGAQPVSGGAALTGGEYAGGYYVPPTVFTGVGANMRIAREEIFGPVVCAIPFDDIDETMKAPTRLTSKTRRKSATECSRIGTLRTMPAAFTSTSGASPNAASAAAADASSVTSPGRATAFFSRAAPAAAEGARSNTPTR